MNHATCEGLGWCTKGMWGRRGEAVSPVQSSLKPCYKGPKLDYVRTIWICTGAYDAAATHPYPTGASASLLSSLLRPNQARVACCVGNARPLAGRPAPHRSAPGSREEGYNLSKREIHSQQQISTNQLKANG